MNAWDMDKQRHKELFDGNCVLQEGMFVYSPETFDTFFIESIYSDERVSLLDLKRDQRLLMDKCFLRPLPFQKGDWVNIRNKKTMENYYGVVENIQLVRRYPSLILRDFKYLAFSLQYNDIDFVDK